VKSAFLFILLLLLPLAAVEMSSAKIIKLCNKGEKVVQALCESKKLPEASGTIEELVEKIDRSQACPSLPQKRLIAVAYYLSNGSMSHTEKHLSVPSDAKCPVCGMFVSKYPKWAATMLVGEKSYYFDGVKDMMKYYLFDADFPFDRKQIRNMRVTDFYTLAAIPAKEAFYVVDSDLFGPMGNELIPFSTEKAAMNFQKDHGGSKVLRFGEITPKIVMHLDGITYEQ